MTAATRVEFPVAGSDNQERFYVTIVADYESGRVVVKPGSSGKWLPKFWPTWFRQMMVEKFPDTVQRIELSGNRVNISIGSDVGKTIALATAAARELHQLPSCPLIRFDRGYSYEAFWLIDAPEPRWDSAKLRARRLQAAEQAAQTMSLPKGYRLEVSDWGGHGRSRIVVALRPVKQGKIPRFPALSDLKQLIELHFTLAAERKE